MASESIKLALSSGKLSAVLPNGTEVPVLDVDIDDVTGYVTFKFLGESGKEVLTLVPDGVGDYVFGGDLVLGELDEVKLVDPKGDDGNDGSFQNPFLTIQAAIDEAVSGQLVLIAPGTYAEGITLKNGVHIGVLKHGTVLIQNDSGDACTVPDGVVAEVYGVKFKSTGTGNHAVDMDTAASTVLFTRCTMQGDSDGNAIYVKDSTQLNLHNCIGDGPVYVENTDVLQLDCYFGCAAEGITTYHAKSAEVDSRRTSIVGTNSGAGNKALRVEGGSFYSYGDGNEIRSVGEDAVTINTNAEFNLGHAVKSKNHGGGKKDIALEAGSALLHLAGAFYDTANSTLAGTMEYYINTDFIGNEGDVTGDTLTDALNALDDAANINIADGGDIITADNVEAALQEIMTDLDAAESDILDAANQGVIGKAIWTPADNPTADDEIEIGGDTYIFKDTDNGELNDPPASPTESETWLVGSAPTGDWIGHENEIATCTADDDPGPVAWSFEAPGAGEVFVNIEASLAETLANLVVKIHGNGTEGVNASEDDTTLTILSASAPGAVAGPGEIPSVSGTEVGDTWVTYAGGKDTGGSHTFGSVALTTANITAPFDIDLAFTPTACMFQVLDATGVPQAVTDMLMTVGASKVTFDPGSDCADTDVLVFHAWN